MFKRKKAIRARYTVIPTKWLDIIEYSDCVYALIDPYPYGNEYVTAVFYFGKIKHS